jgi:protein TonB
MKRSTNALFFPAIGISAALHVALVVFLPYRAAQPPRSPARELVPVSLLYRQVPEVASQVSASKPQRTVQGPTAAQELPAPEPMTAAVEVPQGRAAVHDAPTPVESLAAEPGRSAEGPAEVSPEASSDAAAPALVAPDAEIAGYQTILSTLRSRIVREIRYPALARASGWKGTVVLSVRLDSAGRLEQTVVRRSSGYEVLDRAAAALLRKVTPVSNPLGRPVSIEIPIVYELK